MHSKNQTTERLHLHVHQKKKMLHICNDIRQTVEQHHWYALI